MFRKFSIAFIAASSLLLVHLTTAQETNSESHVVKLRTENFAAEVASKNHLVMFYAPWCGHCQRLKTTWEELATKSAKNDGEEVVIAQVDCTIETELCSQHDVTGYPTLKLFKTGAAEAARYRGARDMASLENFIKETLGVSPKEEVPEPDQPIKGAVELTDDNFIEHTATGEHFIKFYAPWCGHCQKMAKTWDLLAQSVEHDTSLSVAKVDCTQHRTLCNEFDVKGYPTLLWFRDGKKVEKYQGSRTHEDFKAFVERMRKDSEPEAKPNVDNEDGKVPTVAGSPVVQLVEANFENGIASGISFIKFYAPWCGHCKRMAPTWEELGAKFVGSTDVKIAKVDCTEASNRQLCASQKVSGFPTMIIYKNGVKIDEYDGNRSLEDMHSFVTRNAGHDEL